MNPFPLTAPTTTLDVVAPTPVDPHPGLPDGCTLPTVEQPLRVGDFAALFASVTTAVRTSRNTLRLTLTAEAEVAAAAALLAAREVQCCNFFAFTLTLTSSRVTLLVEVAAGSGQDRILDALQTQATPAPPDAPTGCGPGPPPPRSTHSPASP